MKVRLDLSRPIRTPLAVRSSSSPSGGAEKYVFTFHYYDSMATSVYSSETGALVTGNLAQTLGAAKLGARLLSWDATTGWPSLSTEDWDICGDRGCAPPGAGYDVEEET